MTPKPEERLAVLVQEQLGAQVFHSLQQRVEIESLHARIKELEAELAAAKAGA
jgi:BMFP domain-containing protein YqiC